MSRLQGGVVEIFPTTFLYGVDLVFIVPRGQGSYKGVDALPEGDGRPIPEGGCRPKILMKSFEFFEFLLEPRDPFKMHPDTFSMPFAPRMSSGDGLGPQL